MVGGATLLYALVMSSRPHYTGYILQDKWGSALKSVVGVPWTTVGSIFAFWTPKVTSCNLDRS